ncbi:MAG TPA: hypothetical protein VGD41_06250, partial [Pyrinomonadaceae bacterium]
IGVYRKSFLTLQENRARIIQFQSPALRHSPAGQYVSCHRANAPMPDHGIMLKAKEELWPKCR